MKKLLKIIILTMSLLFILSSCSKNETTFEDKNDGKLDTKILVQVEKEWIPYYEKVAQRVKDKFPESEIDFKEISSFEHLDLIDTTDVLNTDVADVYAFPLDRFDNLNSKDALGIVNANKIAKNLNHEEILNEGISKQLQKNGEFLAFPFNIETLIAVVNPENAKKQNVKLNDIIEITELSDLQTLIPIFNAWYGVSITNAFDIKLLDKIENEFKTDLDKDYNSLSDDVKLMFKGIFKYWQEAEKNRVPLFDIAESYGYCDKEFGSNGRGIVRIAGPWEINSLVEMANGKLEIKNLSDLTFKGKTLKHWQGGWGITINPRLEEEQKKVLLAEEFITEIMNTKYASDLYKVSGKIMPQATFDDYKDSDLSDLDKDVIKAVINSYKTSMQRPIFKEWDGVWDTWQNALISWNSEKPKTVEEAYRMVEESFKSLMKNIN